MQVLNLFVAKVLANRGYTLNYKKVKKLLPISDYSEAIYSRGDVYFEIDTRIACNFNQFFFDHRHWHYHTKMVEEIIKNQDAPYEGSILEKYYQTYQPRTFNDLYFYLKKTEVSNRNEAGILKEDLKVYKYDIWSDVRQRVEMDKQHEYGLLRSHGTQHYGPVSTTKGELELQRLRDTYASILKCGHKPEQFGYINGYFLKYQDDYRFFILDGNHRTAVLCAMKYEKIPVTFVENFPRVIDYNDCINFPHIRNGLCSIHIAQQVIRSYFEDNGRGKAQKLGLL